MFCSVRRKIGYGYNLPDLPLRIGDFIYSDCIYSELADLPKIINAKLD